jgi:hypothetical protein
MLLKSMIFNVSSTPLSQNALQTRWIKLGLFTSPLLGAYFYAYTNQSSPLFCPIRALTGIPCPGCGMTRSFMSIVTGNFEQACNYNIFGILVFAGFLIASIHLFCEISIQKKIATFYTRLLHSKKLHTLIITTLFIYHSFRLYNLYKTGELIASFARSPLGHLFF